MNIGSKPSQKKMKVSLAVYAYLFLLITTVAVYWQVNHFSFVDFDDYLYVEKNIHVQQGLSLDTIKWAFTDATEVTNFWAPLTWLSIILDYELYGMDPGGYHVTNLIFHLLNAILVLFVFQKMTGELWKSTFVALIFALHPLHVESVAWVTERKDVLSTFFWMLTIWAYSIYAEKIRLQRYLLVLLFYVFGMMAKPMLVTLPFVLLLLDFWPLGRLDIFSENFSIRSSLWLVLEKIPFFLIALVLSAFAYFFQDKGGVLPSMELIPISLRAENILVSYATYLWQMIWPFKLAAVYPYPESIPSWQVVVSATLLIGISLLSIRTIKKAPWFVFGWCWYLGILIPVIGIVVIGPHCMADRYTYIPMIGITIIIAWGIPELIDAIQFKKKFLFAAGTGLCLFTAIIAWNQVGHWRNSYELYKHTLRNTSHNPLAHYGMANAFAKRGENEKAIEHYRKSIQLYPKSAKVRSNYGLALFKAGKVQDAIKQYRIAIKLDPREASVYNNLGNALKQTGQFKEGLKCFERALKIDPYSAVIYLNHGDLLLKTGAFEKAIQQFSVALKINPFIAYAYLRIGEALDKMGKSKQAIIHFEKAIQIEPQNATAHYYFGQSLTQIGRHEKALKHLKEAIRLNPEFTNAQNAYQSLYKFVSMFDQMVMELNTKAIADPENPLYAYQLGKLYEQKNDFEKSKAYFSKSLALDPKFFPALNSLSILYSREKQYDQAIKVLKKMITIKPEFPNTYYNIACLFSLQNQTERAVFWLEQSIAKGYRNIEKIKTDTDLKAVRELKTFPALLQKLTDLQENNQ